ncbi:MAG: hypothetical protein HON76_16515 [Candidatus Scalindua sp.]|jgi:hypothetical protein|nr:hypothetical protein [Candidatus Scalindua sp.]MBT5306718.1 hypothetical protein [Candidatus Scalindua sp.]MBT6049840.1 hypothetical protein [Candidatus Scalindua sp.]MBT6229133.1 hypothetical protein [Candidatus Scalindua sp.]MBT6564120.1 hypothetical protein [Candidatus Scalindua sp.]
MKKKRVPDKSDLDTIRDQILDFACAKHDFKPEADEFLQNGDWNGIFIVKFRDNPEEERLYCEAPLGEHFIRFGLHLEVDGETWKTEYENILRKVSGHDVALCPIPDEGEESKKHCRLYLRAWTPNFSQRIFGLTLTNLMDCKETVLSMLSGK